MTTPSAALIAALENASGRHHRPRRRRKDRAHRSRGSPNAPRRGKRVVGVARFSEKGLREKLAASGIECIEADLLDRKQIEALPKLANVVFMAGRKFGSSGHEDLTWAMNAHVPALVAEAFAGSRIVAYSTGCVYPYVNVHHGGATEATRRRRRPAPMPIPASRARACSSISRARAERRGASSASTMRSTCATACCTTSPRACSRASRSISPPATST